MSRTFTMAFAAAFVLCTTLPASAQQASTFQDSCDSITVLGDGGQNATLTANCRRRDGSMAQASMVLLGIENTDGDLTHTRGGNPANYQMTCRNSEIVMGGPSKVMLVSECQRRDGSWVGTSTQIWDIDNIDGVLKYNWQ